MHRRYKFMSLSPPKSWQDLHTVAAFSFSVASFVTWFKLVEWTFQQTPFRVGSREFFVYMLVVVEPAKNKITGGFQPVARSKGIFLVSRALVKFFLISIIVMLRPDVAIIGHPEDWLHYYLILYCRIWCIYCFLSGFFDLYSGSFSMIFAWKLKKNFQAPLTHSASPSEFWSVRWNLLVHGLLFRSVFVPMRAAHFSKQVSSFAAFAMSGFFHEYLILAVFGIMHAPGSMTAFFVVQTFIISLLKMYPNLSFDRLPYPLSTIVTTLVLLPFGPLFVNPVMTGGLFVSMLDMIPHITMY